MDKMREAFEAWAGIGHLLSRDLCWSDQYEAPRTQAAWEAWQAATAQCVPEGFVVVPKEPTREMLDAYVNQNLKFQSGRSDWRAMLEAAPKPGEQAKDET